MPIIDGMGKRRETRLRRRNGWQLAELRFSDQELGPGVVSATPEQVLAAAQQLPPELDWESVATRVIPLFERVRPYPPHMPRRVQAIVAPGVQVGFGIDIGPAFITISPELVESWSMSVADLAAHALANLHALASDVTPSDVVNGPLAEVEVGLLQTNRGIGSVLVLAPTELARIFGDTPAVFIAPMRDLLVRLPADSDPCLAAWLYDDIACRDPNCLTPRAYLFDGRQVTVEALAGPGLAA